MNALAESPSPSPFRWPAEWEPMDCIWLAWPHNPETWPGRLPSVPLSFVRFIRNVSEILPVRLLVPPAHSDAARRWLKNIPAIEYVPCETNDCWIRDYGPTFVQRIDHGGIAAIDWQYNAWGGKYPPWDDDAAAAKTICNYAGIARLQSPLTLEGGALETDGWGRLLTTTSCLVTDTRNPGWTQEAVSRELYRCLGVTEILWLDDGGLEGDDTDGHIDQIARFVDHQNVVVAVSLDLSDSSFESLEDNYRQLRIWGQQTEPTVNIHRLPIPPQRWIDGQRVPESYCNFLRLGGERVLVPQFRNPPSDRVAISILRNLLPGTEVVGVDAADLVWGLGAFHCASQQQPKAAITTAANTSAAKSPTEAKSR